MPRTHGYPWSPLWYLRIPFSRPYPESVGYRSDLDNADSTLGNLGDRRYFGNGAHVQEATSRRWQAAGDRRLDLLDKSYMVL